LNPLRTARTAGTAAPTAPVTAAHVPSTPVKPSTARVPSIEMTISQNVSTAFVRLRLRSSLARGSFHFCMR
jgi:hypothetical protein